MKLAIYDFDGTYIDIQTLPFLFKLWKQEEINNYAFKKVWRKIRTRYIFNKLKLFGWDKQTFRANAMALTADLFNSIDGDVLYNFLDKFYVKIKPHISKTLQRQLVEKDLPFLKKHLKEDFTYALMKGRNNLVCNKKMEDNNKNWRPKSKNTAP